MAQVREKTRRRQPAKADPRRAEIQEFLDRLAQALTAGDGERAAQLWATPALMLGDETAEVLGSKEDAVKLFGGAKQMYTSRGIVDTRGEIQKIEWLTDKLALVSVRWPYLDERGEEIGEESSYYAVRREKDGMLKLYVALMQGEKT